MDAIWLVRPAATDAQPRGPLPPVVAELHSRAVGEWRLRVGHFNDVHHAPGILPGESLRHSLDGWPAGSETVSDPVGPVQAGGLMGLIGQAAWLQERARRAGDDMFLLLGAGDDVTGGVLDVLLARAPKVKTAHGVKKGLHAAYTLYNRMGVHACAVGNHDLDRGVARLARAIEEDTRFPILAANLALGAEFADCIAPAAIFQRRGLCVGVIGVTTGGQLPPPAQRDVGVRDPVAAVVATARFLLPYTHVRIVLSHLGLTRDSLAAVVEPLGDRELAARLPSGGVHLIVGGHTHDVLHAQGFDPQQIVGQIPIVQAGAFGAWMGEVSLKVQAVEPGPARVTVESAQAWPARSVEPNSSSGSVGMGPRGNSAAELLAEYVHAADRLLQARLATVKPFAGMDTQTWQSDFGRRELSAANLLADLLVAGLAMGNVPVKLAMIDRSLLAMGFVPGELNQRQWLQMMPHADVIQIVTISAEQLVGMLRDNIRRVGLGASTGGARWETGVVQWSGALRYGGVYEPGRRRGMAGGTEIHPATGEVVTLGWATLTDVPLSDCTGQTLQIAVPSFTRMLARAWEKQVGSNLVEPLLDWRELEADTTELSVRQVIGAALGQVGRVDAENGARIDGRMQVEIRGFG